MSFCAKCGNEVAAGERFCGICGSIIEETAPAVVVAEPEGPRISGGTKAKAFVGLGLSIYGLYYAVIGLFLVGYFGFINVIFNLATLDYSYYYDSYSVANSFGILMDMYSVIFAFVCAVYAIPMGIIGKMLCGASKKAGFESKVCKIGGTLGLVALIVSIATIAMSLSGIGMEFISRIFNSAF